MRNLIFVTLFPFISYCQTLDCTKFKTGEFYYPQIPNAGYSVRNEDKQISYYMPSGAIVTYKVEWMDVCKFKLVYDKTEGAESRNKVGDTIFCEIVETTDECYKFKAIAFSVDYPEGKQYPNGEMCFKK